VRKVEPDKKLKKAYQGAYENWRAVLKQQL